MKILLFLAILAISGCETNKFESGSYKVVSVKKFNGQSVVHLEGYRREFILPTDSLKKDDYIFISAVPKNLQNISARDRK